MFLTTFDKKMYERAVRDEAHAQRLMENGIPYETARKIVTELSENDFQDIYRK